MSITTPGSMEPITRHQEPTLPELLIAHRRHLAKFRTHLEEVGRPAEAAVCRTLIASSRRIERAILATLQGEYQAASAVRDTTLASLDRLSLTILDLP